MYKGNLEDSFGMAFCRQPAIVIRRGQYLSPYAEYAISLLTERKDG